jgi:sugar phosphate isomerase/epimerase
MYAGAMAAAKRPDEKKLVLGGLGEMKSAEALKMAAANLDDAAIQADAATVAVKIAKALGGESKNEIRDAMTKVVAVAKEGSSVRKDAEGLLKQAGGAAPAVKVNKAPRVSVLYAPAARREAAAVDLAKVKKTDLSAAEAMGWRLAFQAYTFRSVTFAETMDRAAAMGVKYVEIYGGQKLKAGSETNVGAGMSDDEIAEMKKIAAAAGVKIVNFGVTGIGGNEAAARKTFEFAKKVGLETLVTEEHEDKFPMLEKLAEEYNMKIALHNHPKQSYYWDADHVLKAVEGFKRIGADADTGHWMRSGLVPLECLKKLQGHIVSLHFKDLDKSASHDVPWGTGAGNARAMLQELKRHGFKGVFSIEYEIGSGQELVDNVAKCVEWFGATAKQLSK